MQLTVRDVARYLNVSERSVYRWIDQKAIPAYRVNDQYRFNKSEILEWASAQKMTIDPGFFEDADNSPITLTVTEAVKNGGIHYKIPGDNKDIVLKNVVDLMPLPPDTDRDFIFQILLAREKMASTALGEGIAIPHVRNPVILNITSPIVMLCFLEKPVEFGALDGKAVYCLFSMISPMARVHLHLLSRLAYILKDKNFNEALKARMEKEKLLAIMDQAEQSIKNNGSTH